MYHQDIERQIHPELLQQFLKRAEQRKITQRVLAENVGITEVQLSRMKRKDSDWRALTPERARQIMEVLNYRASQINAVEKMLRYFKERRTKHRHLLEKEGIEKIHVQFHVVDEEDGHGVALRLERKDLKDSTKILVIISCEAKIVSFYKEDTKEEIDWSKACTLLCPDRLGIVPVFASILFTLRDEWWRAQASDIDNFDTEEDTLRFKVRMQVLSHKEGAARIIGKALRLYEQYTDKFLEKTK